MKFARIHVALISCAVLLSATHALAVEFAVVGPRAAAMGGAGVAVTTDALATYWNPAGLAMTRTVDIRVQGTGQVIDRLGVRETLDDINSISRTDTSAGNVARLQGLLDRLNRPGASVSAIGAAGAYAKFYIGEHAIGLNISDVVTGGLFTPTPLTAGSSGGQVTVAGALAGQGLEARQIAFSYATAFEDRTLAVGATVKLIQGAAYNASVGVLGAEGDAGFTSDLGKAQISTTLGVDLGAVYRPSSWLRLGIVGKDINQPTFSAPGGQEFKLNPQVRGGVAVNPWETMTVAFDGDLLSNKTFVPGVKSRVVSLGLEQTVLAEFLSLRIGATKNTADAASRIMPTGGFGLRLWVLRMDLGGGYDFRERQAMASGSVSLTF